MVSRARAFNDYRNRAKIEACSIAALDQSKFESLFLLNTEQMHRFLFRIFGKLSIFFIILSEFAQIHWKTLFAQGYGWHLRMWTISGRQAKVLSNFCIYIGVSERTRKCSLKNGQHTNPQIFTSRTWYTWHTGSIAAYAYQLTINVKSAFCLSKFMFECSWHMLLFL